MKKTDQTQSSDTNDLIAGFEKTINALEKKINEIEAQYEQVKNIVDNLPGDIYWKDKNGVWGGMNKRCARSLQRMGFIEKGIEAEVLGKTDYQIFDQKTADGYRQNDLEVMDKQKEISREENTKLPSGENVTLFSTKIPLLDKGGNVVGMVGNTVDITYLKKIESELKIAKEAAEAASHAKTEFIANISHDTRTPLTGVIGLSRALEEETITDAERIEYAKLIHASGDQLLQFSESVLDTVKTVVMTENALVDESFDVCQLISDVIALERPAIEMAHLKIETHIDPAIPPYLVGDKMKLHRVLLNLAGNAIKFTKKGGIELNARLIGKSDDDAKIEFSVKDTGIGIAEENHDKVFEQFFKVTPSYKGTYTGYGLGLHIVKKFVDLMGGDIHLTSELGVGTTVSFAVSMKIGKKTEATDAPSVADEILTTTLKSAGAVAVVSTASQEKNPNKTQVLLVEDNISAMVALKHLVKAYDVQVSQAVDAESAFELVKSQPFDLIITDIGLPGLSGNDLTAQIRAYERENKLKPMKIVGLTGHAVEDVNNICLDSGMNEVYRKPMDVNVLKVLIETAIQLKNAAIKSSTSSTRGGLGEDLPNTEAELFEINHLPLLDLQISLSLLDNEDDVREVLKIVTGQESKNDLALIKIAHDRGDWDMVKKMSLKMLSGAFYGTVRMQYAIMYMERYLAVGHTNCSDKLYSQMIRVINETMAYLEDWLSRDKSQ